MESHSSIRSLFTAFKNQQKALETSPQPNRSQPNYALYQENLRAAIATLDECRRLADRLSLFSLNETEDDIASSDLEYQPPRRVPAPDTLSLTAFSYLSIDYYLAELILNDYVSLSDRPWVLRRTQEAYERFLALLDTYSMLSKSERKLYERYLDDRDEFSLLSSSDPSSRRDTKVARFKQELQLKSRLEHLSQDPSALQNDDAVLRELRLAELTLHVHQTFHTLDQIAQEQKILSLRPPSPPSGPQNEDPDPRRRSASNKDTYSDRLEPSLPQLLRGGKAGPILSKEGKPLQPFTLLDKRQRVQNGVFRPDHNLPTMTIDEYLAEEKRRGGMIEGGGEQSGVPAEPDEDDFRRADVETMKAREWDEFKEENPKGSGNTLNRG